LVPDLHLFATYSGKSNAPARKTMRLGDIMSEGVETIAADARLADAAEAMRRQDLRHLVVVEGGAVVGLLSQRNLARRGRRNGNSKVREAMSTPVVTAGPRTNVRQAANLLRGHRIGCLPIVEDGRPVGIITVSDLLDLIGKGVTRAPAGSQHWEEKHRGRRKRQYTPGR
jgi:CBS domain-containing protein